MAEVKQMIVSLYNSWSTVRHGMSNAYRTRLQWLASATLGLVAKYHAWLAPILCRNLKKFNLGLLGGPTGDPSR